MENLVYNDGLHVWARINGKYYRRDIGVGFIGITESALPADIPWSIMPEVMRLVYAAQLPGRE
jgi:hypothetical protein